MNLIEASESNFANEVLQSSVPVIVNFFSQHCGPCRMSKPVMALLAEELGSQARIVTVDVAANSKLVNDYNINAIPTVLVLRGGKEVHRMVGLGSLSELRDALQL